MKDGYGKDWILDKGIPLVNEYDGITLRALHYRLVSFGMPNTINHYKRVISSMTSARWDGLVSFGQFVDHERDLIGYTAYEEKNLEDEIEYAKLQIEMWMKSHHLNRWSNQPRYIEVWIEKKALIGTFENPCSINRVGLFPCKGYPSLTWLHKAKERFDEAYDDKEIIILYFGDYDPSGEDIPRSIKDNLDKMGIEIEIERIALLEKQVIEWNLPPAPTKMTDTRAAAWGGLGQVELDAIEPRQLKGMVTEAIKNHFDESLFDELIKEEKEQTEEYQYQLRNWIKDYKDEVN